MLAEGARLRAAVGIKSADLFLIVSTFEQSKTGHGESMPQVGPVHRLGPECEPRTPAIRILRPPSGNPLSAGAFMSKRTAMTKAENYRKRAAVLGKRMKPGQVQSTTSLGRKQKALTDMADNEDWLDGKKRPKARV
jgi:hypothetical protein